MKALNLKDSSSLNNIEQDCNNGNNKKNVYKTSGTVADKSDRPCNNQDYSDDIKQISHDIDQFNCMNKG
jgi:hypothetical protein